MTAAQSPNAAASTSSDNKSSYLRAKALRDDRRQMARLSHSKWLEDVARNNERKAKQSKMGESKEERRRKSEVVQKVILVLLLYSRQINASLFAFFGAAFN
ncbi:MAG: hypothetical protein MHMPM18_004018 [Marteilia pararefringens]